MIYIEVDFKVLPLQPASEILTAELSEIGFESFVEEEEGLKAYIPKNDFKVELLDELYSLQNSEFEITYQVKEIADQNWNAKWESEYEPVYIENRCYIRAPFHETKPEMEYEILIEPQMSFGTAHHETTYQMIQLLMDENVEGLNVLDMGSGTAVLAILASMKSAKQIAAIDIDEWAYNNAFDNVRKNNITNIEVLQGGAELLNQQKYELILANINKNILLRDMEAYEKVLLKRGRIMFSGFYTHDLEDIKTKAESIGLKYDKHIDKNNWVAAIFTK